MATASFGFLIKPRSNFYNIIIVINNASIFNMYITGRFFENKFTDWWNNSVTL